LSSIQNADFCEANVNTGVVPKTLIYKQNPRQNKRRCILTK